MARLDGISLQRPRGDAEPSRARKLIIKKIVLGGVVLAALPLGGCSDEPTCSSPDALRTLQSIVDENIVDPQNVLARVTLDRNVEGEKEIIEITKRCTRAVCVGDFYITGFTIADYEKELDKAVAARSAFKPASITLENIVTTERTALRATCKATLVYHGDKYWRSELEGGVRAYTVEKTDDEKSLLVTLLAVD